MPPRGISKRPEDRAMAAMIATQIYCARLQAKLPVDRTEIATESWLLLNAVDAHIAPTERRNVAREAPKELNFNG